MSYFKYQGKNIYYEETGNGDAVYGSAACGNRKARPQGRVWERRGKNSGSRTLPGNEREKENGKAGKRLK